MTRILFLLAALLVPSVASAGQSNYVVQFKDSSGNEELLDDVALNAAASARTTTLVTHRMNSLLVWLIVNGAGAGTDITLQLSCAHSQAKYDADIFGNKMTRACSGGTCTASVMTDSMAISASHEFLLEFSVEGCYGVELLVGSATGDGSDTFDLLASGFVTR